MATPLTAAATAALKSALSRDHGGAKLHVTVVDALVAYFAGRGEALTDLPLDYPLRGHEDYERRWLAKLRSATVMDEGDQIDFLCFGQRRDRRRARPVVVRPPAAWRKWRCVGVGGSR